LREAALDVLALLFAGAGLGLFFAGLAAAAFSFLLPFATFLGAGSSSSSSSASTVASGSGFFSDEGFLALFDEAASDRGSLSGKIIKIKTRRTLSVNFVGIWREKGGGV